MNYYDEINGMIDQWIQGILTADRKGFKVGVKGDVLSVFEFHMLKKIGDGENKKLYELVDEMDVDRGIIASSIKKLILGGYVVKEKSKEDKRVTLLRLTSGGRSILQNKIQTHRDYLNGVLSNVSLNEEKIILKFLKKINEVSYLESWQDFE